MFKIIILIANISCVSNIYPSRCQDRTQEDSYYMGDDHNLIVQLKNGKEYEFSNAVVKKCVENDNGYVLELNDGTDLIVNESTVDIRPPENGTFNVNNVRQGREQNGDLFLDLNNGDRMVVKSAEDYQDNGDGNYSINANENTELMTTDSQDNKNTTTADEESESEDEDDDDDDSSSSSSRSILCITFLIGFVSVCVLI